jgi:hypothetical protein
MSDTDTECLKSLIEWAYEDTKQVLLLAHLPQFDPMPIYFDAAGRLPWFTAPHGFPKKPV